MSEEKYKDRIDEKIEKFDHAVLTIVWNVLLSMITAIITTLLLTR